MDKAKATNNIIIKVTIKIDITTSNTDNIRLSYALLNEKNEAVGPTSFFPDD
jgi:hypothetical protein